MSHTIRNKEKLLKRVRRVRGQVEAVERALQDEKECSDVLQLIAAARGAMNGLMGEVLEDHIRCHVKFASGSREMDSGAEEVIDVIRSYLK
jgi:FrmR/RcnR family transcriptional regulator, repressor of rcnA expression